MDIVISIKPNYVQEIISGNKLFEFRKREFNQEINYLYIYQTRPIKLITHRFKASQILVDSPENIWKACHYASGMSADDFFEYYQNSDKAVAIQINNLQPLSKQFTLHDFGLKSAPQSFVYVDR